MLVVRIVDRVVASTAVRVEGGMTVADIPIPEPDPSTCLFVRLDAHPGAAIDSATGGSDRDAEHHRPGGQRGQRDAPVLRHRTVGEHRAGGEPEAALEAALPVVRPQRPRRDDREADRPMLVVEIPAEIDRRTKTAGYLAWGVREVWLIDPAAGTIEIRAAAGGTVAGPGDAGRLTCLPGFVVDVDRFFRS